MQTLPNFRRSQKSQNGNYQLQTSVHENSGYAETSYPINQESLLLSQTDRQTLANATKMGTMPRNTKVSSPRPASAAPSEKIYQKPKTIFDSVDSLNEPWYRTTAIKSLKNNKELNKKFEDFERRRLIDERKKNFYETDEEGDNENEFIEDPIRDEKVYREQERNLVHRRNQRMKKTYSTRSGCFTEDQISDYKSDEIYRNKSSCRSNAASFCITLFIILDILIVIGLNIFGFLLKCSPDGWLYQSDIANGVCRYVWNNVIPFYKRKFVCPSPPRSYFLLQDDSSSSNLFSNSARNNININNNIRDRSYYGNTAPNNRYDTGNIYSNELPPSSSGYRDNDFRYEQLMTNFTSLYLNNDLYWPMKLPWDSDIGFGHPPNYFTVKTILDEPPNDEERRRFNNELYRTYQPSLSFFFDKDAFINSINYNEDWHFPILTFDAIIIFAIIIPICTIIIGEIMITFLIPSGLLKKKLKNQFCFRLPQGVRRVLRFIIIYIGGLYLTICFTEVLKIFFGRLRPDFINACQPTKSACPFWHQHEELKMNRQKIVNARLRGDVNEEQNHRYKIMNDILSQLTKTLENANLDRKRYDDEYERQGFKREIIRMFSLKSCNQKDVLILKKASTSFPSTDCAVAFYAVTFIAVYFHGLASIHKAKFMTIPIVNAILFLLTLVLVPMGRIAHRMSWVDDAIYGSIIGILASLYFSFCILRKFKFKEHVSNRRILNRLT